MVLKLPSRSYFGIRSSKAIAAVCLLLSSYFFSTNLDLSSALAEKPLAQLKSAGLLISLYQEDNSDERYHLSIQPKHPRMDEMENIEVFALENPGRLVIDVPNKRLKSAKRLSLDAPHLETLRLGVHPDKMRIVLDMKVNTPPSFVKDYSANEKRAVVSFSFSPSQPAKIVEAKAVEPIKKIEIIEKRATPEQNSKPVEISKASSKVELPEKIEPESTIKPAAVISEIESQNRQSTTTSTEQLSKLNKKQTDALAEQKEIKKLAQALVTTVVFRKLEQSNQPAVMLQVSGLNTYSLSRKRENLYHLTLDKAKLNGNHLALPLFPPEEYQGFEVVIAEQKKDKVLVKVFVEENISLSPFIVRSKEELWVKASIARKKKDKK